MIFKKNCLVCGEIFNIPADNLDMHHLLFCSQECHEFYYENYFEDKILEAGFTKDKPIKNRWEILDL